MCVHVSVYKCTHMHTHCNAMEKAGNTSKKNDGRKTQRGGGGEGLIYGGKIYEGQLLGQRAHFFAVVPF